MTITNTDRLVTYTGNGVTTSFPYGFLIPKEENVEVTLLTIATGAESAPLTIGVDFSISGVGSDNGGFVTYPLSGDPLASTHKINIKRVVDATQETNLSNQGPFDPETIEDQLDLIVMMIQQDREELSRAVKTVAGSGTNPDDLIDTLTQAADGAATDAAAAAVSAAAAAASAASAATANLPNPAVALNYLRRNAANTAYENRTPAQVLSDIGGVAPTAQSRNRVVNPAMQISQENGNTAGTTSGYYAADQWAKYHVSSAGTLTAQRVQSVTPNGSKDRFRVTITAPDASLAAGEYLFVSQSIEGNEVADLMWGTANAVDIIVRFGFKGPQGTYAVSVKNAAQNRSFVKLFTISAAEDNTDTEVEVVIPGDTSGTWLKDTGLGLYLNIVLAAGSTFQTTADAWQTGSFLGAAAMSNGMGTLNDVFEIFDVGLYADPESTGVAPPWVAPSNEEQLRKCQRYYERISDADGNNVVWASSHAVSANSFAAYWKFTVPKRAAPTISAPSTEGAFGMYHGATNAANFEFSSADGVSVNGAKLLFSGGSGLTVGQGGEAFFPSGLGGYLVASSRL